MLLVLLSLRQNNLEVIKINNVRNWERERHTSASYVDINNILSKNNKKKFVEDAEEIAKDWKRLSNSTIRKIYEWIDNIKDPTNIVFIKPKLAYLQGRKLIGKNIYNFLTKVIDRINNKTELDNFKDFFEAIVAYNKYWEVNR